MGVINEEVIGGLHIAIDDDGQVVPFVQGFVPATVLYSTPANITTNLLRRTLCSLSGRLLLDTTDHTLFDALHFKPIVLKVGDWTAVPMDACARRRLLKSTPKKPKILAASFGAWVVCGRQFAMKFTIDLPPEYLVQMCPTSNSKKRRHELIGIEVAAEVQVGRIGHPNDVAWRQRDKMIWMLPMDNQPRLRVSLLVCSLF
jgi:hypothetical protein